MALTKQRKEKLQSSDLGWLEKMVATVILNRLLKYIEMKSWKTTVTGIAVLTGAIASALIALLDGDPLTVVDFDAILAALAGLGLLAARDNKVTSEQAGAK